MTDPTSTPTEPVTEPAQPTSEPTPADTASEVADLHALVDSLIDNVRMTALHHAGPIVAAVAARSEHTVEELTAKLIEASNTIEAHLKGIEAKASAAAGATE